MPKDKIVYLLGAGATHAVISSIYSDRGLLTSNIRDKISSEYDLSDIDDSIANELVSEKVDIEHLISVVESQYNYSTAQNLKSLYRRAINDLSKDFMESPPLNLYTSLIDIYNISDLNEELLALITLNYEDLLERTIIKHFHKKVNYLVQTISEPLDSTSSENYYQVLKLHGSFNWLNERPIKIAPSYNISDQKALWIPPGVEKRKDNYPFNYLWGYAKELFLKTDKIRIIGCSLSRNDWGLIPLLYTAQRFKSGENKLTIEIIDYPKTIERVVDNYPYLDIIGIEDITEFKKYYSKFFASDTEENIKEEMKANLLYDKSNIFKMWLEAKAESLLDKGYSIKTDNNYFYNFYYKI